MSSKGKEFKIPSLRSLASEFGYSRVVLSLEFIGSAVLTGCLLLGILTGSLAVSPAEIGKLVLGISSPLFGLLIGGLALVASLSHRFFFVYLHKKGILSKILFPFWLVLILLVLSILFGLVTILVACCAKVFVCFAVLFCLWALFGALDLVRILIGYAIRLAAFLEQISEGEE